MVVTGKAHQRPLGVDRRGSGPPLILLHALGADRRSWDPVVGLLERDREVVAIDLPGFGDSAPLTGETPDPAALARAVAAFASDELGLDRPHVAGNSLGGWVALELAAAGNARSVTGIAPAGLWPQPLMPRRGTARRLARAARPLLPAVVRSARGRRLALAGVVARPDLVPPRAAEHLVRAYAEAPGFHAVNDAMRAGRFTAMEAIDVPVTLAWCEHDRLVGPPRRLPPSVRTAVLRGCGHLPTWDDPRQVADLLLAATSR